MTKAAKRQNEDGVISDKVLGPFAETFGLSRSAAIAAIVMVIAVLGFALFWVFYSAPPRVITVTAGPEGSSFMTFAERYRTNLAAKHLTLKIVTSQGSLENLERLEDPAFKADFGFVQGGITNLVRDGVTNTPLDSKLVSLGSIAHQPLLIFYRGEDMKLLSELKGKRLAIGPEGSGTHLLGMTLLNLNGIDPKTGATLLDLEPAKAAASLTNGTVDAVFLMGDSASPLIMRQLLITPGVRLYDFAQSDGYTRKVTYLDKLSIPMGAIDFGKNIPGQDVHLIGPTVEIIARPSLHPALVDLLLEVAKDTHGNAAVLQRKNEFPALLEHDFPISEEATRFHNTGKGFLYKRLPFRWASLINRILIAFVPVVVVLIPALRAIPAIFKWRVRLAMYRRYRGLLALERDLLDTPPAAKRAQMLARLDQIESAVKVMKVPVSFADQFYVLRTNIGFVRNRLIELESTKSKST